MSLKISNHHPMNHKFAKVHAFLLWKHGVTGEGIHSPAMANVD
jgi:hypothetical protein